VADVADEDVAAAEEREDRLLGGEDTWEESTRWQTHGGNPRPSKTLFKSSPSAANDDEEEAEPAAARQHAAQSTL